jgi:hypothetical protein
MGRCMLRWGAADKHAAQQGRVTTKKDDHEDMVYMS